MMPNMAAGGGRTRRRPPQLGMPQRKTGGAPDLNGSARGMGYGGALNPNSPNFGNRQASGGGQSGFDYNAFNAWQDPSIGGQQPGPIQQGWGGFLNSNDSMLKTKMNNYLNQFSTGGDREKQMNGLGYFNGGNPFDPASARGTGVNRAYRAQAQQGGFTDPGSYQAMAGPEGAQGYVGITNVDQSGAATYSPFAPKAGRTRRTRTFGDVRY